MVKDGSSLLGAWSTLLVELLLAELIQLGRSLPVKFLFGISCSTNVSLTISCVSELKNFL
jgi:hypothetical protein